MYEEYFGLKKKPFSIVPDPSYFYMSDVHKEALAHLLYGVKSDGGFVLLTGEVGTGKTTVCRRLLELVPEDTDVAFILNPKVTAEELLATICDEFGIKYPDGTSSVKVFVSLINDYLLDVHLRGRWAVLIIEEAQNLKPEVLEQVRLLTNLETNRHKLLQMIMLGQPELREMLLQPQLRQLSQRITARYHLGPLSKEELSAYVDYRLSVAGLIRGQLFPPAVLKKLYRLSGGVPRLINVICDRALLGAYVQGKEHVDSKTLTTAAREVLGREAARVQKRRMYQGAAGLVVLLCVSLGALYYAHYHTHQSISPATFDGQAAPAGKTAARTPVAKVRTASVKPATLEPPPGHTGPMTQEMAYQALFRQWNIEYNRQDRRTTICEQAKLQGLGCLKGRGSVTMLQQMNRPAVLKLIDNKGGEYYATLTELKEKTATFVVGDETRLVGAKQIAECWSGDYLLLWRAPKEYREELRPGYRGPMVPWLEKQLASIYRDKAPAVTGQAYNGDIVKQVKKFQLGTGMVPDGIVGPKTIIRLSAAAGSRDPVLYVSEGSN
ncbi:MAG: putative general secretion pathway protein A [Syntrophorhabdaceae bacterium PtaU1.Bin034]|nr:MAG: putative general secretion pathway protein A [Syntrophorhabdaceae bacterium PtaU1.Bin034]